MDQKPQRPQRYQHQHQIQLQPQQPISNIAIKSDLISSSDSDDVNTKTVNKINKPIDVPAISSASHIVHNQSNIFDHQYPQPKQQQEKSLHHDMQKDNNRQGIKRQGIKNIEDENSDTSLIEFEAITVGNINYPTQISTETRTPNMQDNKEREIEQYSESEISLPFVTSSGAKSLSNFTNSTVEENFLSFSTSSCNRISHVTSESFQNAENPDYLT